MCHVSAPYLNPVSGHILPVAPSQQAVSFITMMRNESFYLLLAESRPGLSTTLTENIEIRKRSFIMFSKGEGNCLHKQVNQKRECLLFFSVAGVIKRASWEEEACFIQLTSPRRQQDSQELRRYTCLLEFRSSLSHDGWLVGRGLRSWRAFVWFAMVLLCHLLLEQSCIHSHYLIY